MAVTITSNMVTWNAADAITGWTSDGGGVSTYSGFQREGTACLGEQASNGTVHVYYTGTSTNLSNSTIFAWIRSGNPTTTATGGFRIVVGDGTNRIAYYVGGSDNQGFTALGWNLFKLNGANPPSSFATLAGSEASLNWSAITQVGVGWNYGSKAVGSSDNVFCDAIRYCSNTTPALDIAGGTSGSAEGTWSEVVAADESTSNAWGVMRRLVPESDAYGLNFGVRIGTGSASTNTYFNGSNAVVIAEGVNMTSGAMDVVFTGNSGGTNNLVMDNLVFQSVGTAAGFDFTDTNVNTLKIINSQFVGTGTMKFASGSTNKFVRNTIFTECEPVSGSTVEFTNCTFNNSLTDSFVTGDTNWDLTDSTFNSPGDAAICITSSGTYAFDALVFNGTNGSSNYDVQNASTGLVTINASNGSNPTYVNNSGAGATTTINNNVSVTVTGLKDDTEVRVVSGNNPPVELAGTENATDGTTDNREFTFSLAAGKVTRIIVHNLDYEYVRIDYTVPSLAADVPVQQKTDRVYLNP